ncbi:MAG: TlpA family protein disulfide reductase [Nitrospirota bacterium]|nr:TlpA family protein disulfide reductase [Nitrospirota bacterium]
MNKKIVLTTLFVLLVIVALLYGISRPGKRSAVIKEGDRAPEFSLASLDGATRSLSAYRGKIVLVHFWATWCPPCVDEIPVLEQLYRSLFGQEVEILAVSVDEGGAEAVGPFTRKNKLSFPVLLNPDRSVATRYGTLKFPETYVLDREGIVRLKAIGPKDWMYPQNLQAIKDLIAAKK